MSELPRTTVTVENHKDHSTVRIAPPLNDELVSLLVYRTETCRLPSLFSPVPDDGVPVESVYRLTGSEFRERPRSANGNIEQARVDAARSVARRIIRVLSEGGVAVVERMY